VNSDLNTEVNIEAKYSATKCDPLRDNLAHPAKMDFLLEAIIVTEVTFSENVIIAAVCQ